MNEVIQLITSIYQGNPQAAEDPAKRFQSAREVADVLAAGESRLQARLREGDVPVDATLLRTFKSLKRINNEPAAKVLRKRKLSAR